MKQLTNIFKLLSDETRLRMLILLYQEELCVCELSGILEVSQPRISQNLSKFKDQNLVVDQRKEKYVFYTLKKENEILIGILKNIVDDLAAYPKLEADLRQLNNKDVYLYQFCNSQD